MSKLIGYGFPNAELEAEIINAAWENRENISPATQGPIRKAVEAILKALDSGTLRVAEPEYSADGHSAKFIWQVNQWVKKAVLLSFRLQPNEVVPFTPSNLDWTSSEHSYGYDKVPLKTRGWQTAEFAAAGFRMVPGAIVRHSAFIGKGVVLMPSFVNVGAYVGAGTMVDTWATVGSCAQIGKNCHLSGGVGIGGVLEPLQANPTIIEDNCFIGARSEVVEGVIVREGSVLGMGVFLGQSTKIVDRETGKISFGEVPTGSVVVAGSMPSKNGVNLSCAVIVKRVDAKTRAKTSINELLRD